MSLAITARGELRGGNPEVLTAPMMGGTELHITRLLKTGEPVKAGDVVVQFDTTEQEFKLKEALADVAEAEQHLIQAKAERDAQQEEDRYALEKAQTDVTLAELDVRKNPLLPAITAKQNDLALKSARDHLKQVQQNLANRQATGEAGIAIQNAGRAKAEAQATTARQNIESMTLRRAAFGICFGQTEYFHQHCVRRNDAAVVPGRRFGASWNGRGGNSRFEKLGNRCKDR